MTQRNLPGLLTDYRECKHCGKQDHHKRMLLVKKKWFCNAVHFRVFVNGRS